MYGLHLALDWPVEIQVGRLGRVRFQAGCYLYVGSAHGPGGLRARLLRHLRGSLGVAPAGIGDGRSCARAPGRTSRPDPLKGDISVAQHPRRHWHIDYLVTHCRPLAVHFAIAHPSAEGRWAALMNDCPEASIPVPGFGATDTADRAHLWHLHGARARNWLPGSAGERVFTFRVGESGDRSGPGFGQQE